MPSYFWVRSSTAQTPTMPYGSSPKVLASKPSPKVSATLGTRTTTSRTPPSGSSMTHFTPTARRWSGKASLMARSSPDPSHSSHLLNLPQTHALRTLDRDGRILFTTRAVRMFAYGALSVVLALYLAQMGLSGEQIGLLITATLVGDAVISLALASVADRVGRKRMLLLGTGLMVFAG